MVQPAHIVGLLCMLACTADATPREKPSGEPDTETATSPNAPTYAESIARISARREAMTAADDVESFIVASVDRLSRYWLGTTWALGAPQTSIPQVGQVNCGTFVGNILRDVGFNVNVRKLQRQPAQLIIQTFVGKKRIKKFSNAPMKKFLAATREMGPGLFIIGLDFHVGFLIVDDDEDKTVRFIHASYETRTVVDELAAEAAPIIDSKYRVIGKLLTRTNIRDWLRGNRIEVKGNW